MAKKTTTFCTMCGAPNSKENPVVNIYEGLYMYLFYIEQIILVIL